jgi:membrane-bound serine protease (ClpP class)
VEAPFLRAFLAAAAVALALPALAFAAPKVLAVHFPTEVNPVTQDYVNHQIQVANDQHYDAVAIVLDTPGGLSDSMRKIVQKELSSRIPVIVYVSPEGARAASAGVWIGEAADVLAMAPETNIGSSTPIDSSGANLGSDLRRKVVNDAAASLRGLAKSHGRNEKWAEEAVTKASNLTAPEALQQNVVDAVAPTLPALLKQLDGYKTKPRGFVLHLAGADIKDVRPGFFTRLLNTLIDPNLISILFLAGIAGIGFEIFHPGVVLPGALGAVSLIAALFGFSVLPISWAGIMLLLLGLALMVIDVHVVSHGALTIAGMTSLVVGLLLLFHNAPSPYHTSVPLVVGIAVVLGSFWAFAMTKALQVRRRPAAVGPQDVVGALGEVRRDGFVLVQGELWRARSADDEPLRTGEHVRVERIDGLTLDVRPVGEALAAEQART